MARHLRRRLGCADHQDVRALPVRPSAATGRAAWSHSKRALKAEGRAEPRQRRDVPRFGREAGEAGAEHLRARAHRLEQPLCLRRREAPRFRHERRHFACVERVAVERDVDPIRTVERLFDDLRERTTLLGAGFTGLAPAETNVEPLTRLCRALGL